MSTKIYNGYKLKTLDVTDLLDFCLSLQKKLLYTRTDLLYKFWPDYDKAERWMHLWQINYEVRSKKISMPAVDYSCSAVFFPHSSGVYALFYSDHPEYTSLWESQNGVEWFGYYNNSDAPEGISVEEWDSRAILWEEILGGDGYGIPSQCGLSFVFISEELPSPNELSNYKN